MYYCSSPNKRFVFVNVSFSFSLYLGRGIPNQVHSDESKLAESHTHVSDMNIVISVFIYVTALGN